MTAEDRKKLLHAFETLALPLVTSGHPDQLAIARSAWLDIQSIFGYSTNMWDELHGPGTWPDIFTDNKKAWEALK